MEYVKLRVPNEKDERKMLLSPVGTGTSTPSSPFTPPSITDKKASFLEPSQQICWRFDL